MGPTAAGKTGLALNLAKRFPAEIISVDSAQVYRGMDIGTAKPTQAEQSKIPHHLLDIREPSQPYSAADFRQDALEAIADIQGRGRLPILAGGTMLYFRALREGLSEMPAADPAIRAEIEQQAEARGWPAMHARLAETDPEAAATIHPNDPQRIQRALEVIRITGESLSSLQEASSPGFPYPVLRLALAPASRNRLHQRIARRFRQMLKEGLIEEVEALRQRPGLHPDLPAIRSVGYRQVWQFLDGKIDRQDLESRGIAATRQLAKRQLSWLRGESQVVWYDSQVPGVPQSAADVIAQVLENHGS